MRRAGTSVALAVVLLDVTVVAVLVPDIRLDLGSSASGAQWVLNAYLLALAALLPLARLAGDRNPRALAAAGALGMAVGAVVCALSDSTAALVAGRAVQGAGAAAVLACLAEAKLAVVLPALALALGPLVGGVFAEQNWWRVFFWAGVPLAAVAGLAALAAARPEPMPALPGPARLAAWAAGLTAIVIAEVQSEVWSWGWSALLLLAGAALVGTALRQVRAAAIAWATVAGCLAALLFLVPEYFQLARNLSGLRSGTLLLALTLPAVAGWAAAPMLARRLSATAPALGGIACGAVGLAVLIAIDADTRYAVLIGALALSGAGLGLGGGVAAAMSAGEPPPRSLVAAPAGAALGLAAAGAAFQFAQADERDTGASFEQALAAGVGWAALFLLVLLAGIGLVALRLRRRLPAPR